MTARRPLSFIPQGYGDCEGIEIESLNEFDNVSIVNISGQVILDMNVEADLKRTIELNLDGGLYFVQLKNNGKNLGVLKLIIQ